MRRSLASLFVALLAIATSGCGALWLEPMSDEGALFEIEPDDAIDFGLASPFGAPVTKEAWLRSRGTGSVAVEEIVIDQDGRGVFTIAFDPSPCLLSGDDEQPVEFRFHPDAASQYTGRVTFSARANGNALELTRRLTGSGCADADGDGQCAGNGQPGWSPVGPEDDSGGW